MVATEYYFAYLNRNFPDISNIRFALFDFTDTLKSIYLLEKIAKYNPGSDSALFLVHTDGILDDSSQYRIPQSKKIKFNSEHVKIIGIQQFTEMLGIDPDSKLGNVIDQISIKRNQSDVNRIKSSLDSIIKTRNIKIPSTNSFIDCIQSLGYISDSQSLVDVFCHFDEVKIRDTLIDLRSTREYRQKIIQVLKDKQRPLTKKEFKEILNCTNRIIHDTLQSMAKKGQLQTKLSHNDEGRVIKYFFLHGMQEPKDPYDEKRKKIIEDFKRNKPVEQIFKDNNISQKFYTRVIKEEGLSRPNILRKKHQYIRKIIDEKWNEQFLWHIMPTTPYENFLSIKNYKLKGRSYFDKNNPLKKEILTNHKHMSPSSILYSLDIVNDRIKSIYQELLTFSEQTESFNIDSFIQKFLDISEEEFSDTYSKEQFIADFRKYFMLS